MPFKKILLVENKSNPDKQDYFVNFNGGRFIIRTEHSFSGIEITLLANVYDAIIFRRGFNLFNKAENGLRFLDLLSKMYPNILKIIGILLPYDYGIKKPVILDMLEQKGIVIPSKFIIETTLPLQKHTETFMTLAQRIISFNNHELLSKTPN